MPTYGSSLLPLARPRAPASTTSPLPFWQTDERAHSQPWPQKCKPPTAAPAPAVTCEPTPSSSCHVAPPSHSVPGDTGFVGALIVTSHKTPSLTAVLITHLSGPPQPLSASEKCTPQMPRSLERRIPHQVSTLPSPRASLDLELKFEIDPAEHYLLIHPYSSTHTHQPSLIHPYSSINPYIPILIAPAKQPKLETEYWTHDSSDSTHTASVPASTRQVSQVPTSAHHHPTAHTLR